MVRRNYNKIISSLILKAKGDAKLKRILIEQFSKNILAGKILKSYGVRKVVRKTKRGRVITHHIDLNWN